MNEAVLNAVLKAIMNEIYCCDCVAGMRLLPAEVIPLTVTSPPYDNIRTWPFPWTAFQAVAQELYRVTMPGGIVAWVVQDQHQNWSESGTSFKQALHFMEIGFNLYTSLVIERNGCRPGYRPRYWPPLEYAFILSKGKPRFFDLLRDRPTTTKDRAKKTYTLRNRDGSMCRKQKPLTVPALSCRTTIWRYMVGYGHTTTDKEAHEQHPALMPEQLAQDLIRSFGKPGELVFDPMAGLGTTCKMAMLNGHPFLGFEQDQQYCRDARNRLKKYRNPASTKAGSSTIKEARGMLMKLNRFMTTDEVQEKYGIPAVLAPKILPLLPFVHEQPDGTRIHLESEVDEFLVEFARQQRQSEARRHPASKQKQGRKIETWEIADYANEQRKQGKIWKAVFSACKKRWPNDARVKNQQQVRATWNRHFQMGQKKAN